MLFVASNYWSFWPCYLFLWSSDCCYSGFHLLSCVDWFWVLVALAGGLVSWVAVGFGPVLWIAMANLFYCVCVCVLWGSPPAGLGGEAHGLPFACGGVDRDTHSPQSHYFYYFSARVVWLSSWVNYQLSELLKGVRRQCKSRLIEQLSVTVGHLSSYVSVWSSVIQWTPAGVGEMARWWDGEMARWWDGEMVRWWDGEMVRWWDGEMARWWDGEMVRWWDGEMVRWWDGELKFPLLVKFMCTERDVTRVMRVVLSVALGGPFTYRGVALVNLQTPPSSFEVSGGSTCVVRHLVIK